MMIYVHIPFCVRKCRYCDFLSFPLCEGGPVSVWRKAYVDALCREIEHPVLRRAAQTLVLVLAMAGLRFFVSPWNTLLFGMCAAPLLWTYNGRRGPQMPPAAGLCVKYAFYLFYPLHLAAVILIRTFN